MVQKEMTILVGKQGANHLFPNNTFFYRFFAVKDGNFTKMNLKKGKENSQEVFEQIVASFLENKKLISLGYDLYKPSSNSEEYIGLKLQNNKEKKLNVYFTSNAMDAFIAFEEKMQKRKEKDFFDYASRPILKNVAERVTIRPTNEDRSSVLFVFYNEIRDDYFKVGKNLGYYYRKFNNQIDNGDLKIIFDLIRYFINVNIKNKPYYDYRTPINSRETLFLHGNPNAFIEIQDNVLIRKIEKARILDDLWLLNRNLLDRMPSQEESIVRKEELKRIRNLFSK